MTVDDAAKGSITAPGVGQRMTSVPQDTAGRNTETSALRIRGLDAARGFALFGMIIVHTMPGTNPDTGGMTLLHELFFGYSAPLFGLLAGVSLALITGATAPHTGRRLRRDRVAIATRAVLLLMFGLTLNLLPLEVFSILPFYAVYFMVGVLFTGLSVRALLAWASVFALGGPVVIYMMDSFGTFSLPTSLDLALLFSHPLQTVMSLAVTDYYPAVTWMAYIVLGMALGRLDLSRLSVQIRMCVWGGLIMGAVRALSQLLMSVFGSYDRIVAATPLSEAEINRILEFGGRVPTDSWWWLAADGPHSNTPFSVVDSAGLAVLTLGAFLLAARVAGTALAPLGAAGSMTFTFYTAHLLLVTYVDVWGRPVLWTVVQILFALVLGLVWRALFARGPLEALMSAASKGVGRILVPEKPVSQDEK